MKKYVFVEKIIDLRYYLKKYKQKNFIVVSFNIEVTLWCIKNDIDVINGEDLLDKYQNYDIDGKVKELTHKWKERYDEDGTYFLIIRKYIYYFYNLLINYEIIVQSFFDNYNNIAEIYVFDSKSPFRSSVGLPEKNQFPDLLAPVIFHNSKKLNIKIIKINHRKSYSINLRSKIRVVKKWLRDIYLNIIGLKIEKIDVLTMKYEQDLGRFLEMNELMDVEKNYKTLHFMFGSNQKIFSKKVIYFSQLKSTSKEKFNFDNISFNVPALHKEDELYFNAELFDFQFKYWFSELTNLINIRYQKLEYLLSRTTPKIVISTMNFYDFTPILEILQKKYHFKLLLYPHGARFYELNSFESFIATAVYPKSWWDHYIIEKTHYTRDVIFLNSKEEIQKNTKKNINTDSILIITAEHPLTIRFYKNNKLFYNEFINLFTHKKAVNYKFIIKPHPLFDFKYLYNLIAENFDNVTVNSQFKIDDYLDRIQSVVYLGSVSTLMFKFKALNIPQFFISSSIINKRINHSPKYYDLFATEVKDSNEFYDLIDKKENNNKKLNIDLSKNKIKTFDSLLDYINTVIHI